MALAVALLEVNASRSNSTVWMVQCYGALLTDQLAGAFHHLACAKFSGILGIRTCNRNHDPLQKSCSKVGNLYIKVVELTSATLNLYCLLNLSKV